jgi:hypothetical protein
MGHRRADIHDMKRFERLCLEQAGRAVLRSLAGNSLRRVRSISAIVLPTQSCAQFVGLRRLMIFDLFYNQFVQAADRIDLAIAGRNDAIGD